MTSDKARKKVIRARMAGTGEPYSVAARALKTDHDDPPGFGPGYRAVATIVADGDGWGVRLTPAEDDDTSGWSTSWRIDAAGPRRENGFFDQIEVDRLLTDRWWVRSTEWPGGPLTAGADAVVSVASSLEEARAAYEATFATAAVDQPCRCSTKKELGKPCSHGRPCADPDDPDDQCDGRLVHVDRYPGSMFSTKVWEDVYVCNNCRTELYDAVTLGGLPWGEQHTIPFGAGGETTTKTVVYDGTRHPAFPDEDD